MADKIFVDRMKTWDTYYEAFSYLKEQGRGELSVIPKTSAMDIIPKNPALIETIVTTDIAKAIANNYNLNC